jgi:hypothetical protein
MNLTELFWLRSTSALVNSGDVAVTLATTSTLVVHCIRTSGVVGFDRSLQKLARTGDA